MALEFLEEIGSSYSTNHQKNWIIFVLKQNTKIQLFKSLMKTTVYMAHMDITTDAVLTG